MELFILYLISFLVAIALIAPMIAFRKKKWFSSFWSLYKKIIAIVSFCICFSSLYLIKSVMIPDNGPNGTYGPSGNVNLNGVPYGDNRLANFFAWLSIASFFPGAFILIFGTLFPNRSSKLANVYIIFPTMVWEMILLFVYLDSMTGNHDLSYKNILIAFSFGSVFALSLLSLLENRKESKPSSKKEVMHLITIYLIVYFCCLPANTFATLLDPNMQFFGVAGRSVRIEDFSQAHRIMLYLAIFIPIFIYFTNRNEEINAKKTLTLSISLGVIGVFFSDYGAWEMFPIKDAVLTVNVNMLPLHLCHTALFVVPLCIAFNWKRLFYFTYFINVFGAISAMIWPNTGSNIHFLSPSIMCFWYNHIAAFSMPLLAVALGLFPNPKMKQMFYSLAFFALYMASVVFLNAWLSNYVSGYDPDVLGSGTDYLFVNGTYIVDIISDQAYHLLDARLSWQWGDNRFVIYPLYQSLFFVGYVGIAFAMWFVYSLFFSISASHSDLHNRLVVMRMQNISYKEKEKMAKIENVTVDHEEANLKFINFSKRYGNSEKLSADNVNLEVKAGEIFGFLGPNGAGKSTCIKTAIGIQPISEGEIKVCGYDVRKEPVECKKNIGYVPDHYALYEKLTGREYINYIADLYGVSKDDRDQRIAKYVDLFELNQAFDNRMQTYSHGMKQKMTIMAALVHEPKIWILDEPLTGLDPQSIYQVKEVMKEHAKKGNVVFFSSHIINVVEKLCTRVAIIKKGKVVYESSMKELTKSHPEGLEEFYMDMIRDNGDLDE